MNLQKGDPTVGCRARSLMVKSAQDEEEEAENFSQLELSYLHLIGDLSNL